MKKYRLVDNYEGYGIVGEYDTIGEILIAAYKWMSETDYECDLRYFKQDEQSATYIEITKGLPIKQPKQRNIAAVCRKWSTGTDEAD